MTLYRSNFLFSIQSLTGVFRHNTLVLLIYALTVVFSLQPAHATNLDIYGKLELQGLYVEQGLLRYADQGWQIEAPSTRLGAKASQPLAEDWSLLGVYEWQVNGLDHANQHHRFGSRNLYAGIANPSFGELTFGKNDSRFNVPRARLICLMKHWRIWPS